MLLQHQHSFLRYDWIESGLVKAAEDDLAKVCPGGSRHVTSKLTFSCQIYLCWMVLALFVDSTFAQKHGLVHPKLRQLVESFTISSEVIVTHPLEQLKKHAKKRLGKMSRAEQATEDTAGGKRAREDESEDGEQMGRPDKRVRGPEEAGQGEGGGPTESTIDENEQRQEGSRSGEGEEQGVDQAL